MRKKGMFIVFEGIDGAGKSKQIQYSQEYLSQKGYQVILTREPGGTKIGAQIRKLLLDPENTAIDSQTELLLYAADRAQHIKEIIIPALERNAAVLCDRFTLSTIAYQGYGRRLDMAAITALNSLATGGLKPDLTLILDIEPDQARKRIEQNRQEKPDRLEQEKEQFFKLVRQGYLDAAGEKNTVIINGGREPETVFAAIKPELEALICGKN